MEHIQIVLNLLRENLLYGKWSKCEFLKPKMELLGHVVSEDRIQVDPKKVQAVKDWKPLKNVHDVRCFLGMCNYYRRFIERYAHIVAPITKLLRKDTKWKWTESQQKAFDILKERLVAAPVLRKPDFSIPFILTTDASDRMIGAVLSQKDEMGDRPVAYESRRMTKAEENYPIHEKEMLAIIHALKIWRVYLEGQKFRVNTDHKSLIYWQTQPIMSS